MAFDNLLKRMQNLEEQNVKLANKVACLEGKAKAQNMVETKIFISHQLADSVEVMGLREVIKTESKIFKLIWLFFFVAGITLTIYFVYQTAVQYFKGSVLTRARLESQAKYEYPPIVLCNDAWYDADKALKMGLSMDSLIYSLGYIGGQSQLNSTNSTNNAKTKFLEIFQKHNFPSLTEYYKEIATDIHPVSEDDFLYNHSGPSYVAGDGYLDPNKVLLPTGKICYAFFVPPVEKQYLSKSAINNTIILKFMDRTQSETKTSSDWQLFFSFDWTVSDFIPSFIKTSTISILTISANKFISLSKRNASCKSITTSNKNYTDINCVFDCVYRLGKSENLRVPMWLAPESEQTQPERFFNFLDPDANDLFNQLLEKGSDMVDLCGKKCPPKCERILFEATITQKDLGYMNEAATMSNFSLFPIEIEITHKALGQGGILVFEEIDNYSYIDLLNNVGGTLGLFVGSTLMTFVQLILFFVSYWYEKRNTTSRVHGQK